MTMINVLFQKRYGTTVYNSEVSTRISNALLVGAVLGQVVVGIICDRIGRKSAIGECLGVQIETRGPHSQPCLWSAVLSTIILCTGAIFATAATPVHHSVSALFWWLTVARGATGFGVGAEYPASSTSCSEAANERYSRNKRSTIFILCTNVVLSFGGPLAVSIFLIVLSASQYGGTTSAEDARRLDIVWRIVFGIGALLPLSVFYFRMKMMNSKLYRKGAIKHNVPYWLFVKRYWPRLIGTCGAWL
jgi:MFS family permease